MDNWILEPLPVLAKVFISLLSIFTIIILIACVSGLRTFAKMSSFDFPSTITVESMLASIILNTGQSISKGATALGKVIGSLALFSFIKRRSKKSSSWLTNSPMMIMDGDRILYRNPARTNVSKEGLIAQLRESIVRNFGEVLVVVLESTGNTVSHTSDDIEFERERLVKGVDLGERS